MWEILCDCTCKQCQIYSNSYLFRCIQYFWLFQIENSRVHILKSMLTYSCAHLCVCVCVFAALLDTCAVGSSAVNVVIGLPLLSNLVGVDEYDQHCNQTDERHQHRRAQSCIDVRDEAPKGGRKCEWLVSVRNRLHAKRRGNGKRNHAQKH